MHGCRDKHVLGLGPGLNFELRYPGLTLDWMGFVEVGTIFLRRDRSHVVGRTDAEKWA